MEKKVTKITKKKSLWTNPTTKTDFVSHYTTTVKKGKSTRGILFTELNGKTKVKFQSHEAAKKAGWARK